MGACDMPDAISGGRTDYGDNPFRNSKLIAGMCLSRNIDSTDFPGRVYNDKSGPVLVSQSAFSFLKDKDQYITFSSNAPVTMTWTSSISDANEQTASFTSAYPQTFEGGVEIKYCSDVFIDGKLYGDARWC